MTTLTLPSKPTVEIPTEPERKFLVTNEAWKATSSLYGPIYQGFIEAKDPTKVIRIRTKQDEAWATFKGPAPEGSIERPEFEVPMPLSYAKAMLETFCDGGFVQKTRHRIPFEGRTWEVDVFEGENAGLIMAEVELHGEPDAKVNLPSWAGREVTHDPAYHNVNLAKRPYSRWSKDERQR